jgi:hypothetical protein
MVGLVAFAEGMYNYRQLVASSIQGAGNTLEIEAHLLRQQRQIAKDRVRENRIDLSEAIAPYTVV